MSILKNISLFIVISFAFSLLTKYLESDAVFDYLKDNIIGLIITLMAINTASLGLIASKIQDFITRYKRVNFSETINQMKISLLEQIILIPISLLLITINESQKVVWEHKEFACDVLLLAVLIYSINILWDTGKAVFIIIDEINKE